MTTEECDADEHYKQTYIQAEKEDIVIVKVRSECREEQSKTHF